MELLIIGGGPGGYVAAIAAAKRGAKVTLVEKESLGGTCLNRGCIPTKTLLHSANLFHQTKDFAQLGIVVASPQLDFAAVMARKDAVIKQLRQGVEFLLSKAGVTVLYGQAQFLSRHQVAVQTQTGETTISAENVIIATGSTPSALPFAPINGQTIINSDHALELDHIPESLAIVGGGVVGCELAQAFARMGSRVTVFELLPKLLGTMDGDQSALIQRTLKKDGVELHLACTIDEVVDSGKDVEIRFTVGGAQKSITVEKLLVATGRKPATSGLAAEAAGIALDHRGAIPVDALCRTNVDGIYAIGDVTGGVQLAHVASHQGMVVVNNLFGAEEELDHRVIPYCVYTSPELASMGYTEALAKEAGFDVNVGAFPVSANGRSLIEGVRDGFSKVVTDRSDGTILGLHLAGPNVTEMISPFATAIKFEATAEDMEGMIFAHPTVSEIIHESILDTDKKAIHKV